jgi:hypothetical protein
VTPSKQIWFHSAELQKAVFQASPILENLDEARDRLSRDIKGLEDYLQDLNLTVPFRYALEKFFVEPDEIREESLAWDKDKAGKFRLLFELSRWEGYIGIADVGSPLVWNDSTLVRQARPLIEAKFEDRKRMFKVLPDFVQNLAEFLSVEDAAPMTRQEEDIPF